mmetsp:Transcript_18201/g.58032  ORF Transcript_18201/g.58032 Transcript_18201/m.58032 type:complete len:306 (-) Transcript_18201:13-930(-)
MGRQLTSEKRAKQNVYDWIIHVGDDIYQFKGDKEGSRTFNGKEVFATPDKAQREFETFNGHTRSGDVLAAILFDGRQSLFKSYKASKENIANVLQGLTKEDGPKGHLSPQKLSMLRDIASNPMASVKDRVLAAIAEHFHSSELNTEKVEDLISRHVRGAYNVNVLELEAALFSRFPLNERDVTSSATKAPRGGDLKLDVAVKNVTTPPVPVLKHRDNSGGGMPDGFKRENVGNALPLPFEFSSLVSIQTREGRMRVQTLPADTEAFMSQRFYEAIDAGKGKAEALKASIGALREVVDLTRDPPKA